METAKEQILETLKGIIGGVYEIGADQVDGRASFLEMGLDSISIIQVKQLVKNTYGFDIAVDRLFDDVNNLEALAGFIMEKLPAETVPSEKSPEVAPPPRRAVAAAAPDTVSSIRSGNVRPAPAGSESGMRQIINDQITIMQRQMEMLARMNS
jgi:iturin family lipopeptide synthetase A